MSGCEATSQSVQSVVDGVKQWCLSQTNFNKNELCACAALLFTCFILYNTVPDANPALLRVVQWLS
jgi:hypothetical protein